jgi:hypothetical protein
MMLVTEGAKNAAITSLQKGGQSTAKLEVSANIPINSNPTSSDVKSLIALANGGELNMMRLFDVLEHVFGASVELGREDGYVMFKARPL